MAQKTSAPSREEISSHTIKLIVGVIALSLATLTSLFAKDALSSISASYYEETWSRTIFLGFLFAIGAFLFAYNGQSTFEMVMSKVAAVAAIVVALFPCDCGRGNEIIPHAHFVAAATMFLILAGFCYIFLKRALAKRSLESKVRAAIYALCGVAIVGSIVVVVIDVILKYDLSTKIPRLVFYCEATGLVAFGIAWLTASRTLPLITAKNERYSISPYRS